MSKFTRVLLAMLVITTMNGCNLFKKDEGGGSSDGGGVVDDGSGGGVNATPTPHGMNCDGSGGGGGGDSAQQFDSSNGRLFVSNMIAGSFVNSVSLKIKISPTSGGTYIGTGTTHSTPMTLKLHTCGSSGSKGSLQGTANTTLGLHGGYKVVTFTFSTPVAIPTTSGCGTAYAAVFELIGTANMANQQLSVESEMASGSCDAKFSNSGAGSLSSMSPRAWTATIATSP